MECLTKSSQPPSIHLVIDAKALDGAAIVHLVGHSPALRLDELWVRFVVGTHFRQIAIQKHSCSSMLVSVGATRCLAASATEKSQHGYPGDRVHPQ